MHYLYHWVPKNMKGDTLYPLNQLKEIEPEIYATHVAKYKGREEVMELVFPKINCKWNDALHLSPIHPQIVKDAIAKAGGISDYKMRCYQIEPHTLDPKNAIVYLYSTPLPDMNKIEDFIDFNPDELGKYSGLPKETIEHYVESFKSGSRPLTFHRAPHILYKGSINISNSPIIEV